MCNKLLENVYMLYKLQVHVLRNKYTVWPY
jgi:hypothetical protein